MFFTVIVLSEDVAPGLTLPKLRDTGEAETLGGGALPETFTFKFGFTGSLEIILTTALFFPKGVVGANVPLTTHEAPAVIIVQSFVWLNSEALVPVMSMLPITRSEVPVFFTVIVLTEDVAPDFTFPKLREAGEAEILGEATIEKP
ncbi:MAG TPA: hypothetical protein VGJ94_02695 [Syntrophorhabdaceae bacterium]